MLRMGMPKNQSDLLKRSEPFRELLRELLKERIRTEADKEKLAAYLGKSKATVNKMLYEGEIGLDVWVNSLIYCYDLNLKALRQYIKTLPEVLKKQKPLSSADELWVDVSAKLTQKEKIYYGNLLICAIDANRILEGRKPSRR